MIFVLIYYLVFVFKNVFSFQFRFSFPYFSFTSVLVEENCIVFIFVYDIISHFTSVLVTETRVEAI